MKSVILSGAYFSGVEGPASSVRPSSTAGCPILAAFFFLRPGWETANPTLPPSQEAAQ